MIIMRLQTKILTGVVVVPAVLVAVGYALWRREYPYGFSHCCDLILYSALQQYATTHGGAFPAGEATPEASLSLLYREKCGGCRLADERLLSGKTIPEPVVKEILDRGDLLAPETCGWHYVEGLRMDDNPQLALFWDKVGLGHNGERLAEGGHSVMMVDGQQEYIPGAQWEAFVKEQHRLLAERGTAADVHHSAVIRIDGDEVRVQIRIVGDNIYGSTWGGKTTRSREQLATVSKQDMGIQGLPVISKAEIGSAKVVVEPEKSRVRFVLIGRELVYDRLGFHLETRDGKPPKN
jgi:hypothetical protein